MLNDAGGRDDATSLAAAVGLLTDALSGEHNTGSNGGGGGGGSSVVPQEEESWERGVAVPNDPEEEGHSVESGLRSAGIVGGGGDVDEVDQVDVIMQVRCPWMATEGLGWRVRYRLTEVGAQPGVAAAQRHAYKRALPFAATVWFGTAMLWVLSSVHHCSGYGVEGALERVPTLWRCLAQRTDAGDVRRLRCVRRMLSSRLKPRG